MNATDDKFFSILSTTNTTKRNFFKSFYSPKKKLNDEKNVKKEKSNHIITMKVKNIERTLSINRLKNGKCEKGVNVNINFNGEEQTLDDSYCLFADKFLNSKIDPVKEKFMLKTNNISGWRIEKDKIENNSHNLTKSTFSHNYSFIKNKFHNKPSKPTTQSAKIRPFHRYTFSNPSEITKVESLYKTELKVRENINRSLKDNKNKFGNSQFLKNNSAFNLSINDKEYLKEDVDREVEDIVTELYQKERSKLKAPFARIFTREEKINIKKNNPDKIPTSNFYTINNKLSFPYILNDVDIICKVYNDNLIAMKTFLNKKLQEKTGKR